MELKDDSKISVLKSLIDFLNGSKDEPMEDESPKMEAAEGESDCEDCDMGNCQVHGDKKGGMLQGLIAKVK